ncbi:MAG: PIN domain-containing protein [Ginsengibacter sp.]
MGLILADTNVVIYMLQGDQVLAQLFDDNKIAISFITELELLTAKKFTLIQGKLIQEFINNCIIYNYTEFIKEACINLRLKYSLRIPDAIIAATAKAYKIPLFTSDKHFSKITEIGVSIYSF